MTTKIVFTDASEEGYGGFICERLSQKICCGKFQPFEKDTSSTEKELLAVKYVLKSFGNQLQNESIKVHVDNFNVSRILSVGSCKENLQEIAIDIFKFCLNNNIKLIAEWIPRKNNTFADRLSRFNDTDNWGIDYKTFEFLSRLHGPFTVDRFADHQNTKLQKFNSRFYCPGTSAVDTFTVNWQGENNWVCPPTSLIGSTLRHMKICECKVTLLIPLWPLAYFWPLIYPDGIHLASFIKNFTVVKPFYICNSNSSVFSG